MQSLMKNWFVVSIRNLVNFHPTTQKSTNFTLMGYFCPKYMTFELKKYRGVIFHDTEQWWKISIKPDLVVSKMAWGIWRGWTFIRTPKILKNCTLIGSFCQKHVMFHLKFQRNYVPWHWKVFQSLKENWLVAWKIK